MRTSKHWCGRNAHRLQSRGDRRERGPRSIPHITCRTWRSLLRQNAGDASLATAPSLYAELTFDPVKDLVPIAMFATVPHIVVASPEVGVGSLDELIALAKKTPGKLNFGSGRIGSPLHLAGEALRLETGIPWTHVAYRGAGPAIIALLSNEVRIATSSLPAALSQVQAGKIRALAVMSPKRLAALPDVPTVAELGFPKATVLGWVGLHAPTGTPQAILMRSRHQSPRRCRTPNCARVWRRKARMFPPKWAPPTANS